MREKPGPGSGIKAAARAIEGLNRAVGHAVSWVALLMVIVQMAVVVLRYVFGVGSIFLQESILYMHGVLFMVAAGYTLLEDGHVRVDVFYRGMSPRRKAAVDLAGSLLFLLPFAVLVWWVSWDYVAASWAVREGSRETSGIQAVYLLKSVILVFDFLVALQGVALAIRSGLALVHGQDGEPTRIAGLPSSL